MEAKTQIKIDFFNEKAAGWDSDAGRQRTAIVVADSIKKAAGLSDQMRAMDFGCGTGLVTMHLQPYLQRIDAVDTSPDMLKTLQQKLNKDNISNVYPVQVIPDEYNFEDQSYDLIFSNLALHHVADYKNLLNQFYQALKINGRIAIADLASEDGYFHSDNSTVEHFGFEKKQLHETVRAIGFRKISIHIIHQIEKITPAGIMKKYPLFLISGQKWAKPFQQSRPAGMISEGK